MPLSITNAIQFVCEYIKAYNEASVGKFDKVIEHLTNIELQVELSEFQKKTHCYIHQQITQQSSPKIIAYYIVKAQESFMLEVSK